jgi:hypothetical protein
MHTHAARWARTGSENREATTILSASPLAGSGRVPLAAPAPKATAPYRSARLLFAVALSPKGIGATASGGAAGGPFNAAAARMRLLQASSASALLSVSPSTRLAGPAATQNVRWNSSAG